MLGSLALHRGVLLVGRHERTVRIGLFDLATVRAIGGFSFRDGRGGSSAASGLAVDEDLRILVADTPCSRVRLFSVFGAEIGGLGVELDAPLEDAPLGDAPGLIRSPVDVACQGNVDEGRIAVALRGERRHALQIFDAACTFQRSLRPAGRGDATFRGVRGIAYRGRFLFVAETGRDRIHVYRDEELYFSFAVTARDGRSEPQAVAPLADGRMVVVCGGRASAALLFDSSGRLLRILAESGNEPGAVRHPSDVVVDDRGDDGASRVYVLDQDAERVQLFTLEGRCEGELAERA